MSKGRQIEIIARGVCVKNGRLLLCHTKGKDNTYLPGGHVEFGESAAHSLEREIREELGVPSRTGRFLGAIEHTFRHEGKRHCEINLVFEVEIPGLRSARPPKSREDYIEFQWGHLSQLPHYNLEPAVLCEVLAGWMRAPTQPSRWSGLPNSSLE